MHKVKIPLFLWGMEELAAGLNVLRQWQLHKGGGNEWKDRGNVWKGLKEFSARSCLGLSHWSLVTFIGWLLRICLRKWDGVCWGLRNCVEAWIVLRVLKLYCVAVRRNCWGTLSWHWSYFLVQWALKRFLGLVSLSDISFSCRGRQCIHSFCRTLLFRVHTLTRVPHRALDFVPFSYVQSAFLCVWNRAF